MAAKKVQGWFSALLECTRFASFALFLFRVVCVLPLPMLYESKPVFVRSLLLCVYM